MLTGKYKRDEAAPEGSRFADGKFRGKPVSDATWNVVEGLRALCDEKNVTMDAFALAWVGAQAGVTSPIIGPNSMEQLEANLLALDVEISDEDNARVDELIAPGTSVAEFYNADWKAPVYR